MSVWKLTKENLRRPSFTPDEFLNSETATRLKINNEPDLAQLTAGISLADKMQELRDAINKPFHITSGFRSRKLNEAVGGAKDSMHIQFLACDFNIEGMEPHEGVLAIKDTEISIDKCFVERGCIHMQIQMNAKDNKNFFGSAYKVEGKWKVIPEIKKI